MTGQRFGRLTVMKRLPNLPNARVTNWECLCDCGGSTNTQRPNLISGHTKSCGCIALELIKNNKYGVTHNQSRTRLYSIWQSMKQRCYDENVQEYHYYGGRGITICDEWLKGFKGFYKWSTENGYTKNLTIDRINNYKGYSPNNCRWLTIKEQNRNKRENRIVEIDGVEKCTGEWSEILGIPMSTIINRLNRGCSADEALNTNYARHTKGIRNYVRKHKSVTV